MAHDLDIPGSKNKTSNRLANLRNAARGTAPVQEPTIPNNQPEHEESCNVPSAHIPAATTADTPVAPITTPTNTNSNRPLRKTSKKPAKGSGAAKRTAVSGDNSTDSASKLRKATSDPTAQRISARIPQSVFFDLQCMKTLRSESTDYIISASLQDRIYRQFTCACGANFSIGGTGAETAKAVVCPICRSENIRRIRHNR